LHDLIVKQANDAAAAAQNAGSTATESDNEKIYAPIKLIVIDSVAFHFRRGFGRFSSNAASSNDASSSNTNTNAHTTNSLTLAQPNQQQQQADYGLRSRLLHAMAQQLLSLAQQHTLAVVLMNQVTTRFNKGSSASGSSSESASANQLMPSLGESWAHACTNRVMLYWLSGIRHARVVKSASKRCATAQYRVAQSGITTAFIPNQQQQHQQQQSGDKRRRHEMSQA
jgi:RecA/RadA recombinase